MKLFTKTLAVATLGMIMASTAQAQLYVGAKAGQLRIDIDEFEKPMTYGAYAGYEFSDALAVEGEFMKTEKFGVKGAPKKDKSNFDVLGLYGVYKLRMPGQENLYVKGKLGASRISVDDNFKKADSETGVSFGLGAGMNVTDNIAIEAEYVKLPDVVNSKVDQINIGASFSF